MNNEQDIEILKIFFHSHLNLSKRLDSAAREPFDNDQTGIRTHVHCLKVLNTVCVQRV